MKLQNTFERNQNCYIFKSNPNLTCGKDNWIQDRRKGNLKEMNKKSHAKQTRTTREVHTEFSFIGRTYLEVLLR